MAAARVLVVDDEPAVLGLTARVLNKHGYDVTPAPNGPQAIEIVHREQPFDLLISDYVMPGMDGPELIEAVRQTCPDTAVMLMSAYSPRAIPEEIPLLRKPFSAKELLATVERVLAEAIQARQHLARARERSRHLCLESQRLCDETLTVVEKSRNLLPDHHDAGAPQRRPPQE